MTPFDPGKTSTNASNITPFSAFRKWAMAIVRRPGRAIGHASGRHQRVVENDVDVAEVKG
jgi:hypothetical protein